MNKHYKISSLLAVGIISLAVMSSCVGPVSASDSDSNSGSNSTSPSPTEDVTVKFWHTMGQANTTLLNTMITQFNAIYPNIKIEHSSQGGYDDLKSKLKTAIAGGTEPTMAFCYPDHVADYLASGASLDLTSFISDPEIGFVESDGSHVDGTSGNTVYGKDDFVKGYWDEGAEYTSEGVYSVPFSKSTEALFYNKDFFDANDLQVPETWDEMWTLCAQIKAIAPSVTPLGYDSDSNLFITMCEQRGIPYTSATGDHFLFSNPQAKAMVAELKGYYDEGLLVTKGASPNSGYTSTQFTNGEVMMTIGSTGGTSYNQTNNFVVGVAVPPTTTIGDPAVISQGPSITFFKRSSTAQLRAAWQFYRFISNSANSAAYAILTGYEPVRISSYETANYQSHLNPTGEQSLFNKVAKITYNMKDSYFNSPVFVGSATARVQVGNIIAQVFLGEQTIDQAFETAMTNCVFSA